MTDNNHRSTDSLELQQGMQEELSKLMADLAETRRIANSKGRPLCEIESGDVAIAIGLLAGGTFIFADVPRFP